MLDLSDPVSGVIGLFFRKALDSKIGNRLELLLELFIAFTIAFLCACGGALIAKQPVPWSIGLGMMTSGVALFATFQASPHSKGLVISVQSQVAQDKFDTPTTTIERK